MRVAPDPFLQEPLHGCCTVPTHGHSGAPDRPPTAPPANRRRWPLVAAALVLAAAVVLPLVGGRWSNPSGAAAVAGVAAPADSLTATSVPGTQRVVLDVSGMVCTSCERTVMAMLARTPGVVRADVSVARREAIILYYPARTTPGALITVVKGLGYRAVVRPG